MNGQPIILFDGVCNLCNSAVDFVVKRDKKSVIKFAALQSDAGERLLKEFSLPRDNFNSFVFVEGGISYTRSSAALKLCKYLTGLWPLMYGFIIVPKFIRDFIYKWVAKNRYKWFGKREQCMIPTQGLKNRFLP